MPGEHVPLDAEPAPAAPAAAAPAVVEAVQYDMPEHMQESGMAPGYYVAYANEDGTYDIAEYAGQEQEHAVQWLTTQRGLVVEAQLRVPDEWYPPVEAEPERAGPAGGQGVVVSEPEEGEEYALPQTPEVSSDATPPAPAPAQPRQGSAPRARAGRGSRGPAPGKGGSMMMIVGNKEAELVTTQPGTRPLRKASSGRAVKPRAKPGAEERVAPVMSMHQAWKGEDWDSDDEMAAREIAQAERTLPRDHLGRGTLAGPAVKAVQALRQDVVSA
mmetsp:Transcript_68624/g.182819  ORF Transcript_68624/g.182819 Transcript_68624/m.182819 type:complete len:272 (+) Transcript_68624:408-1223(+)